MDSIVEVFYEQRTSERLGYVTKIVLLLDSGENIVAKTFNISENGVGMTSNLDIPVGTKIKAQIYFDTKIREVEGRIKWSSRNPVDDTFKYGIQLSDFPFKISKK
jgi:hypothetical protein